MSVRAVLVVLLLPVFAFAGSIENTQELELPVKDIQSIHIICGPGFLNVFGVESGNRIKVRSTVKISGITQDMLQEFLASGTLNLVYAGTVLVSFIFAAVDQVVMGL